MASKQTQLPAVHVQESQKLKKSNDWAADHELHKWLSYCREKVRLLYHVTGDVTTSRHFSVLRTSSTWTPVSAAMSTIQYSTKHFRVLPRQVCVH